MANRKAKLSAIVLFALLSAAPAHAVDFDWFQSVFGVGGGGGNPPGPVDPSVSATGPGGGGGHPGVDPTVSTTGPGGGGDPGVDPD